MPRPSLLLRWANAVTGGFPGRIEPNDGKKDVGFDDGEAPAAGEHNWIFGLASDWIEYLDGEASRLLLAALTDVSNVFTARQIVDIDNAEEPLLFTNKKPGDDTRDAANKWKILKGAPHDGVRFLNIYVGANPSAGSYGAYALVTNAVWRVASQDWAQDDITKPSAAFIITDFRTLYSSVAAGTAAWAVWPTTAGDSLIGGTSYANSFRHATTITRNGTPIPISSAFGSNVFVDGASGDVSPVGAGFVWFGFRLPTGTEFTDIDVMHVVGVAAVANTFKLYVRALNWATPAPTTLVEIGSGTSVATAGRTITRITTGARTFDGDYEYVIRWDHGNTDDSVQGMVAVAWDDLGPSNV